MQIKKKVALALVGLIVSGCATGLPVTSDINKIQSVEILSTSELNELEQEYKGFTTKALTEAYLLKKILKWKDDNNGLKMVKEIDFARQRHPDLFKTIMTAHSDLFTFINGMADVNAKKLQNDDFRTFIEGSDPFPAVPGILSADNISPFGFTAHWAVVAGANSYEIVLDSNAPVNVGNNLSYVFDDLSGTNHTFKVRAIKNPLPGNYSATFPVGLSTQQFIYVKANATGSNNGRSWTNAYTSLQSALENALSGQEIWIAAGTYKPTTDMDKTKTFQLKAGVNIYGGFFGSETLRAQRNFNTNVVILSGDLNGNDIDGNLITNKSDNVYNVVVGVTGATIDGVSIKYGYASGDGVYGGFNDRSYFGGGIYNNSSSPTLTNVTLSNNFAGIEGGGIINYNSSSPTLTNVTISNNLSTYEGGGMFNYNSISPTLTNVIFFNNSGSIGGGIYNNASSPILTNVIFSNNSASQNGGGMFNAGSTTTLTNITFSNNSAQSGGGIYNQSSSPTIKNSIIWGNTAPTGSNINNVSSTPNISYSDIQGGFSGTGNINSEPLFANVSDPDGADNIFRTSDDGLSLSFGSPAINTGTNSGTHATDIIGTVRPMGLNVDMGAYETPYVSVPTDLVPVAGGTFQMGAVGIVEPVHSVTVSNFYIGKYEVRQSDWTSVYDAATTTNDLKTLMHNTADPSFAPPGGYDGNLPVENISWFAALAYCNARSLSEGFSVAYDTATGALLDQNGNVTTDTTLVRGYRLATEAEWEFAARGGNKSLGYTYAGSNDPNAVGWYNGNSSNVTRTVGGLAPNELGLYDMSGNVAEWNFDWFVSYSSNNATNPIGPTTGSDRIIRGGTFTYFASTMRNSTRAYELPNSRAKDVGFRVVRSAL